MSRPNDCCERDDSRKSCIRSQVSTQSPVTRHNHTEIIGYVFSPSHLSMKFQPRIGTLVCPGYDAVKYTCMPWTRSLLLIALVPIAFVAAFAYRYITAGRAELEYVEESVRVPVRALRLSTREEGLLLGDLGGQAVLIDVWASWCSPCVAAIPKLLQLQKNYGAELEVVGLNVDQGGWEVVEAFLARHPEINFRIARAQPEPALLLPTVIDLEPLGTVSVLPTAFLVDGEGRLVSKYVGAGHYDQINQDIERLLSER